MSIWHYADHLPPMPLEARVTLGEGHTPLIPSRRIGPAAGLDNLYFKLENTNPTGSYKDRFAAAAVSDMLNRDVKVCLATSSGNTGAALAAYCAAGGLPLYIAIVESAPDGKLRQMQAYGAHIFRIRDFGLDSQVTRLTFETLRELSDGEQADLQISAFIYSPRGMAGVQTIAYELVEQLPTGIDHVFSPAGGGGLQLAVARGFQQAHHRGQIKQLPKLECVQPEGNNTIAGPLRHGAGQGQEIEASTTTVSGLQVPQVLDGHEVILACRASKGTGHLVSDEQVYQSQIRLAREEGIFCEPAGAVALAGALKAGQKGLLQRQATVVCLITGIGFKDEPSIRQMTATSVCPWLDTPNEIEQLLSGGP